MKKFSHLKIQEAIKAWVDTYSIEISMWASTNALQVTLSAEYYNYLKENGYLLHSVTFMNRHNLEISMNINYVIHPVSADGFLIHPVHDDSIEHIAPKFWYDGITYVTTYRKDK